MTKFSILPAVLALGLITGCSEGDSGAPDIAGAAGDAAGDMANAAESAMKNAGEAFSKFADVNFDGMTPDKMKEKGGEMINGLASQLGNIKDLASAEAISEKAGPLLDKLGSLKGLLGDNLPDMSKLSEAVSSLTSKFGDQTDIMNALKPMLDKIKGMIG